MALPTPIPGFVQPTDGPLRDRFGRVHTYLRVSVTDRCNFRCTYCMPAAGLAWLPRSDVLTYEEIARLVGVFVGLGVRRVRLTGGEPTLRKDLHQLVAMIAAHGLDDISMTTNAHSLEQHVDALVGAGLNRVNISLDSVDAEVFREITRGGDLDRVLAGIEAARASGLTPVKVNCVVVGGVNDDGIEDMVEYFAVRPDTQLRFIEFMPFVGTGGDKRHVPSAVLRERLERRWSLSPVESTGGGPSRDMLLSNGLTVGFISPITEHFCQACNRLRLQADGSLRTCLSRDSAPNLRDVLRSGVSDAELDAAVRQQVFGKVAGHEADKEGNFLAFEGVMTRVGG